MNTTRISTRLNESKEERNFEKVLIWFSSFSMGILAAFLASIRQVNPSIALQFSFVTVAAFAGGSMLTALFLRSLLLASKKRRALLILGVAIVSMLLDFFLGIKNSSRTARSEVLIGMVIAVVVLSFLAWVLWQLARFFDSDQQENQNAQEDPRRSR